MRKSLIIVGCSVVILAVLGFGGLYYYQSTHFNQHAAINNIKVGGLTADQALTKLKSAVLKNIVYVGQEQVYDGKDTKMGFGNDDLPGVKKLIKKQQTWFPSSKEESFTLAPVNVDRSNSQTMKKELEKKLSAMNKNLQAPKNAEVHVEQGKLIVSKGESGTKYDVPSILKDFQNHEYESVIHLNPVYVQPAITMNSPKIEKEKQMLQKVLDQTVNYELQGKPYPFKGSEVISKASITKDMKVTLDLSGIKKKLSELNETKSTLNKDYSFKTHSGSVISVKGASYGWAINVDAEAKRIEDAFLKGEKSLLAYNIYGVGWNINGVGYHNPAPNGIGDTYVEVSIKDQRIWVYKNGQLKVTTRVVTGRHDTNEDTSKGVWYIEYKQSPSVLEGSEAGNPNYSVKVNYWAPFTMDGQGLHDASWRSNWAMDAYLHHGSGGCVNTPPSVMKQVYDNVSQYEPVVIY